MRVLLGPSVEICIKLSYPQKEQYHSQSLNVLHKELDQKKMPHSPSHMKKEGGAKV
jgi:hypothetical protein